MSKLRNEIRNCEPKIIGNAARTTVPEVAGMPDSPLSYHWIVPKIMPNQNMIFPSKNWNPDNPKSRRK